MNAAEHVLRIQRVHAEGILNIEYYLIYIFAIKHTYNANMYIWLYIYIVVCSVCLYCEEQNLSTCSYIYIYIYVRCMNGLDTFRRPEMDVLQYFIG